MLNQTHPLVRLDRATLAIAYLDFLNNYATTEKWAEHHGLTVGEGVKLLAVCKSAHENPHPEN